MFGSEHALGQTTSATRINVNEVCSVYNLNGGLEVYTLMTGQASQGMAPRRRRGTVGQATGGGSRAGEERTLPSRHPPENLAGVGGAGLPPVRCWEGHR
jgi:hypothetical protein